MTNHASSDSEGSLRIEIGLPDNSVLQFRAGDIRRERTGVHAVVAVLRNTTVLAHDVFNIGRNEERGRLARSAHTMLNADLGALYSKESLKHDLDIFCLSIPGHLEGRFTTSELHGDHQLGPVPMVLRPYLVEGGGTILFAPPGAGKTFIALLMAQSIHQANGTLWDVVPRKVLYVNLERSEDSLWRRMGGVNDALMLNANASLPVLTARGHTLKEVAPQIKRMVRDGKAEVIFVDSLSRAGLGTMVDDENANAGMDMLNAIAPTWVLIAHSPRADDNHVFGSQMYDAAADVVIRLKSARGKSSIGLSLKMTKANDVPIADTEFLELAFTSSGLSSVKAVQEFRFPELMESVRKPSDLEKIIAYMTDRDEDTAAAISKAVGVNDGNVSRYLRDSGHFTLTKTEGRKNFYALKAQDDWPSE